MQQMYRQQMTNSHSLSYRHLFSTTEASKQLRHWSLLSIRRSSLRWVRVAFILGSALLVVACSSSGNSQSTEETMDGQSPLVEEQSVVTNGDQDLPASVDVVPQTDNLSDTETPSVNELTTDANTESNSESDTETENEADSVAGTEIPEESSAESLEDSPANSQSPLVELSPVTLLLDEIRIAAASPLLDINRKLQTGMELDAEERNCLDGFNAASGQALTSIDCAADENGTVNGIDIYDGEFKVNQARLADTSSVTSTDTSSVNSAEPGTTNCEQSLFDSNTESCQLQSAEIELPVIWVPTSNGTQPGPIASIAPVQGAAISYNTDAGGLLILQSVSDLFVDFYCEIDIANAALRDTALATGDCRQQVQRLINRLFAARTASDPNQAGNFNEDAGQ